MHLSLSLQLYLLPATISASLRSSEPTVIGKLTYHYNDVKATWHSETIPELRLWH